MLPQCGHVSLQHGFANGHAHQSGLGFGIVGTAATTNPHSLQSNSTPSLAGAGRIRQQQTLSGRTPHR